MAKSKALKIVAEICLYGNREVGSGWLASVPGGHLLGDGEPRSYWSLTDALWMAVGELRVMGVASGAVRIFAPGGRFAADVKLSEVGYYGNLPWKAAPQYEIDVAELIRASGVPV